MCGVFDPYHVAYTHPTLTERHEINGQYHRDFVATTVLNTPTGRAMCTSVISNGMRGVKKANDDVLQKKRPLF